MTDKPGPSPSPSGNPFRSRTPFPAAPPRGLLPRIKHLLRGLSLPFRVAASFALISMLLSVVGIGYAAYSRKDSDQAFSGGLSIALGFIASGAIGIYLLVDHYLATIARIELERHRAVEQLRVLEDGMLRGDGLAAMTAGIAHDFKNLITPFRMGLDVVERQPMDAQARVMLGLMQKNLEQAGHLIEELLVFGNVTSGEVTYRPVELGEILRGYEDIISPRLPPGIDLQLFVEEGLPAIRANPEQVLRALQHLVLNARDAIVGGVGRITITAAMRSHQDRSCVGLSVTDNGVGIKAEVLPQIFTPFFTTKSRGRGTGMGLAIVRGIIRGHQGDIDITSVAGQGTTATLLFPPLAAAPDRV